MSELEQHATEVLKFSARNARPKRPPYLRDATVDSDGNIAVLKHSEHLRPLVVDLDGTLLRSDLLIETAFAELSRRPLALLELVSALKQGKAALKHRLATTAVFDPAVLPYDEEVLRCIRQARAEGRPVYLASASHEVLVGAVADHLELFDGWFATDELTNCAGKVKAHKLVEAFGEKGFDYIGNDAADLHVWPHAAKALAIRAPARVGRALASSSDDVEHLTHERAGWRSWAKLMRVHQYAKNGLVFVPLITSQVFEFAAFMHVLVAAIAFSLCASSVYILNDLIDLQDDRGHRSKRHRPLANGSVPLSEAMLAIPVLLGISLALGAWVSLPFLGVLLGYFALTSAYTFLLKRKMIADVITLAGLYSVRVVGGAVALSVALSPWLLAFTMSWFLSLALIKRYVELQARREANLPDATSRDYRNDDIHMVGALAAAASFNAITLFVLYASSDAVIATYSRPELLWFVAPILAYWIGRALMVARRGEMHDDPVVFALKDRLSVATLAAAGLIFVAAF